MCSSDLGMQLQVNSVLHCWAPLQDAFTKMDALHQEAVAEFPRLFPRGAVVLPEESLGDPDPVVDDDFEETYPVEARDLINENERMHNLAVALGVPLLAVVPGLPIVVSLPIAVAVNM